MGTGKAKTRASAREPERDPSLCGAATRSGGSCKRKAGAGTDHKGYGNCAHHGGSTPNGVKHAARLAAVPELEQLLGYELEDADPFEALTTCIKITRAEIRFYDRRLSELGSMEDFADRQRVEELDREGDVHDLRKAPALSIWQVERTKAVERLGRFSKMAIDAGVAVRQVELAESLGEEIADVVASVIDALGLSVEQQRRVPELVRAHLTLLEGGAA